MSIQRLGFQTEEKWWDGHTDQREQQKAPSRPWRLAGAWPWRQQMRQPSPVSYRIVEECFTDALQPCEKALARVCERARAVVSGNWSSWRWPRHLRQEPVPGSGHQGQLLGQPCRYEATRCRVLWAFTWPISLIGHACESKRLFS